MSWIDRQRNIVDFTLASLIRRKGKNSSLLVVYTLVIFVLASVMFFTQALQREAAVILDGSPALIVQRMAAGRHDLIPAVYADAIRKVRGVRSVTGRLWGYFFDPAVGANYTLLVPPAFAHGPGSISIGRGISRNRGLVIGDTLMLRSSSGSPLRFTVAGVMSADSELATADLVLMGERDFRALFAVPRGSFTDLAVDIANPRECPVIASKVVALHPDTRAVLRDEILRTYQSLFGLRSGMVIALLASSVLAFVILAWDKATGLSAEERAEIGILKAVGWDTADVLLVKFWEGAAVSLTAFLAGTVLAYVHVFLAKAPLFAQALRGWSVIYPDFRLTPFIDAYQVTTLFFLTVVPYTVATIVPSWRAATVDPDAVMRS